MKKDAGAATGALLVVQKVNAEEVVNDENRRGSLATLGSHTHSQPGDTTSSAEERGPPGDSASFGRFSSRTRSNDRNGGEKEGLPNHSGNFSSSGNLPLQHTASVGRSASRLSGFFSLPNKSEEPLKSNSKNDDDLYNDSKELSNSGRGATVTHAGSLRKRFQCDMYSVGVKSCEGGGGGGRGGGEGEGGEVGGRWEEEGGWGR